MTRNRCYHTGRESGLERRLLIGCWPKRPVHTPNDPTTTHPYRDASLLRKAKRLTLLYDNIYFRNILSRNLQIIPLSNALNLNSYPTSGIIPDYLMSRTPETPHTIERLETKLNRGQQVITRIENRLQPDYNKAYKESHYSMVLSIRIG